MTCFDENLFLRNESNRFKKLHVLHLENESSNISKIISTSFIALFSSKVEGRSVAISMPMISTACSISPCLMAKASETTMAAAEPSEVGQHCSFVNGPYTVGLDMICSRV